jgi:microcystin-dependent protein
MLMRPQHTGRALIMLLALVLLAALSLVNMPAATAVTAFADDRVESPAGPTDRPDQPSNGTSLDAPVVPGSKNDTTQPAVDPNGVTHTGSAALGPKNDGSAPAPAEITPQAATATGWRFISCGTATNSSWSTTSATFAPIRSCTLDIGESGFVYLSGSSSVGRLNGEYEARFRLGIDSASGNTATDRWVNIYNDSGDGTDKAAAVTLLIPISAGVHTFSFLGARYAGAGTVLLYSPSLSVLYFPDSSADVQSCGASGSGLFNTLTSTFQTIRSCSLSASQSGFAFISATASAGLGSGGAYEGRVRVGVDSVNGLAGSDRWVNVYPDSGDGTDEAVATSLLTPIVAGSHTFYFLGARYSGAGTVQLYNSSLSVLYFPSPNVTATLCSASGSDVWTNATTSYTVIRSCSLNIPRDGFAFVDATASAELNASAAGNEWEGHFGIGVDNVDSNSAFDRWVNAYTDSGDGTDRAVADAGLVNISAGPHTFYFVGKRYAGTGTLRLYAPSLTVLVPDASVFLPLIIK